MGFSRKKMRLTHSQTINPTEEWVQSRNTAIFLRDLNTSNSTACLWIFRTEAMGIGHGCQRSGLHLILITPLAKKARANLL
jgi:hypothetical protein